MHELPIIQKIYQLALSKAQEVHAKSILEITIALGEFSTYVPEVLDSYFHIISENTIAANCKLSFHKIEATVFCFDCNQSFITHNPSRCCPKCGRINTVRKSGNECYIETMRIEDDDSEN